MKRTGEKAGNRPGKNGHPGERMRDFDPLTTEEADRILRNVLRTCGYAEAHIHPSTFIDHEDYTTEQVL